MGKKDKVPKEDPNKITEVDRTFYEITINDLNQKLARLRSHLIILDENNVTLKQQLDEVTEDRTAIAAHLELTVERRTDSITELQEHLVEISKVRSRENNEAAEKIKDLEMRYKAMQDQLTSEIKLLNGKLNSLDEFRMQRDVLMAKFDDQEAEAKEKARVHQELIYSMEQQAIVEKDALRQEMEEKLLQVSEDFTRASEIRNAGYSKRLIRENIALQRELETMASTQMQMQKDAEENAKKNKEIAEQYQILDRIKTELIQNSNNKIKIIERLTGNYERLRDKHVEVLKYRRLYENLAKQDVCERFTINDLNKKLKILGHSVASLKTEKKNLITQKEQNEKEISRLRAVLYELKIAIQIAIKAIEDEKRIHAKGFTKDLTKAVSKAIAKEESELRIYQRRNLLNELLDIISNQIDDTEESLSYGKSSFYKSGKLGFLPRSASCLMEIFKSDVKRVVSAEVAETVFTLQKEEAASLNIPQGRAEEAGEIIDIHMGPALYISDSHEDFDMPEETEVKAEAVDGEAASGEEIGTGTEAAATQKSVSLESKHEEDSTPSVVEKETTAAATPSEAPTRGSRVSRMSRQPSLPTSDDESYAINLFY